MRAQRKSVRAFRVTLWRTALWLGAVSCQDVRVADFNTPEICTIGTGGFMSYVAAKGECGENCQLCAERVFERRIVSYFVSHEENCVCAAPSFTESIVTPDSGITDATTAENSAGQLRDAGLSSVAIDGGGTGSVADAAGPLDRCVTGTGYVSRVHAQQACERQASCHVCPVDSSSESSATAWAIVDQSCPCPPPSRDLACGSHTGLTRQQAETQCLDAAECKVCVERINLEKEVRGYLAHGCGCPDPYRLD